MAEEGKMETLDATKRPCKGVTADGSRCRAAALPKSDFCFFHDASKAKERRDAQALGGRQNRARTLDATVSDVKIKDCGDILALLSETINQVRTGAIDPRVANSVGYLANIAIRVFEQRDMETRIERLEDIIERRSQVSELAMTGS